MTSQDAFLAFDAEFIARHVLENLGVVPAPHIELSSGMDSVLGDIERLETSWTATESDPLQYGAKDADEQLRLWSVPKKSAMVLAYLAAYSGSQNILEIGTSAGYSSLHLAKAHPENIWTIENHSEKVELAHKHVQAAGLENTINVIQGDAKQVLERWDSPVDFVFLDADKPRYGQYLDLILPHMESGLLVADNVNDYGHLMKDYFQKIAGSHFPESRCYENIDSTYIGALDNGLLVSRVKEVRR